MERFGGSRNGVWCSFCEKSQRQVRKLVAGPGVYICNECIDLCSEILENEGIKKEGVAGPGQGEVPASPVAEDRKPRMDALANQGEENHGLEAGPGLRTPAFSDVASGPEVQHRVVLSYDHRDGELAGALGDETVEWHLDRHHQVPGRIGDHHLEATWATGNNYVPEPGGWTPCSEYVSDFPNIPADLTAGRSGTLAGVPRRAPGVGCSGLIRRGEVDEVDLGQPVGHESGFMRPAVVVSVDI